MTAEAQMFEHCLYTVKQVQSGEQKAADACGVSMMQLMSAAGKAVFYRLQALQPAPARIAVCCGEGNNGGDGYIVARLAQQAGYQVQVFALKANATVSNIDESNAQKARQAWRDQGGSETPLTACEPEMADVVVDAVFGVGLNRALEGAPAQWAQCVNQSQTRVLSVDVPSGVNADTGDVPGAAIRATQTVTLVALKRGLLTGMAPNHVGQLCLEALGVGEAFQQQHQADWLRVDADESRTGLPPRAPCTHKGEQGHVLIVGGQPGMSGAVILAMQAALRSGAGKVSVACHPQVQSIVAGAQPEAMVHGVETAADLQALLEHATVVALGPGLGQSRWSQAMFEQTLGSDTAANSPRVLDADALNLLAQSGAQVLQSSGRVVLTPHPGEAARLLQTRTQDIAQDRFAAAQALRDTYGAQVLLKGAGSLVVTDNGSFVIERGSPAMASGGMGDLLTGLISGLIAQKAEPAAALLKGTLWHAMAGETAGNDNERGTLASDLLPYIRQLVNGNEHHND